MRDSVPEWKAPASNPIAQLTPMLCLAKAMSREFSFARLSNAI
jgi:hypothetical protein